MKKLSFIVVLVVIIGGYLWYSNQKAQPAPEPARLMSIESFVRFSISELSPVKETLGGKFYITSIETTDGKGVVSYEDGHNAYTADFTYDTSGYEGYNITSFVVRD